MRPINRYLAQLSENLSRLRTQAGLSQEELEQRLILGPGWISAFEKGKSIPDIEVLIAILFEIRTSFSHLVDTLPDPPSSDFSRSVRAESVNGGLLIRFRYSQYEAIYRLDNATVHEYEAVVRTLRDGLAKLVEPGNSSESSAKNIKTDSVAQAFLKAAYQWPDANPSDLWWFIIYRAYCDPFNHPAVSSNLDFAQSWKRTGGWALEKVLVRHYGPFLENYGIHLYIPDRETKEALLSEINSSVKLESDKVDVVMTGGNPERLFGVVHVKTSFAERRTDDVPMSVALRDAGYTTPFWTMDCKSMPGERPNNKGELGPTHGNRSAKRRDIEDEEYFTGCFSYNQNTVPSDRSFDQNRRIYVCNFRDPDDLFTQFIRGRWQSFRNQTN